MSVERGSAVVGQQLLLRVRFAFDQAQNLFDPTSMTKVEIQKTDGTVLETITTANITKDSTGKYHVITSASWNTLSRTVVDRWYYVVAGTTYESQQSTFIPETSSPSTGLQSFVDLVKLKVQFAKQDVLTDPDDYEKWILEAVKEYSNKRPYKTFKSYTGDNETYFSVPSDWEHGFSHVSQIEYPVESFPPTYIADKDFVYVETDQGWVIRFVNNSYPQLSDIFWLRYTKRHTVNASSSTIPIADKDAVCNLAASLTCQAIAEYYGNTADSTLEADVISYRTRGDEFSARGKELRKLYNDLIKDDSTGVIGDYDKPAYWNTTDLMHDERVI